MPRLGQTPAPNHRLIRISIIERFDCKRILNQGRQRATQPRFVDRTIWQLTLLQKAVGYERKFAKQILDRERDQRLPGNDAREPETRSADFKGKESENDVDLRTGMN